MSVDPYLCPNNCGELLIKTENRISSSGYPIPLNYNNGLISARGEPHICPKKIKMPPVPKKPELPPDDKALDLHEYLRCHLKLGKDGMWYKYIDNKYAGVHSKATKEEMSSWDPSSPDGIDHSRDGTIHT